MGLHPRLLISLALGAGLLGLAVGAPLSSLQPRQAQPVPQYVIDFAPLVKLTSNEPYQPADIAAQLANTHPAINLTDIDPSLYPSPLTLDNLDALNSVSNSRNGNDTYLAANDDFTVDPKPAWLLGTAPSSSGSTDGAVGSQISSDPSSTISAAQPSDTCKDGNGQNGSPGSNGQVSAAIIVNDHGDGVVDAFYLYFYAYDNGPSVLGSYPLGSHVGDWEHNMIRFVNSAPDAIWYSEHSGGNAFRFDAANLPKSGQRPISYSAIGTHANYATAGDHAYGIPNVQLPVEIGPTDHTDDDGNLWDPTLSAYYYHVSFPYSYQDTPQSPTDPAFAPTFTAANNGVSAGAAPTAWLNYNGQWGDDALASDDPRQNDDFFGVKEYTGGPNGPKFKGLNRKTVCLGNAVVDGNCFERPVVLPGN